MSRSIESEYRDPLELVWLHAAQRLGWRVVRSDEVFASWDGAGVLTLSTPEHLDPDDSLAQLVFHEMCHALVEGPEAMSRPDWALHNRDDRDLVREHACHRLQAALATPWGLRVFLGPTTEERAYYDRLPADPLSEGASADSDAAIAPALAAWERAHAAPWDEVLHQALSLTAALAGVVADLAPARSLWRRARATLPGELR